MTAGATAGVKRRGFTLLDLLAALLIIGVLSVIAVPTFRSVTQNAADRTLEATGQAIARAANTAAQSTSTPPTDADLATAVSEAALPAGFSWNPAVRTLTLTRGTSVRSLTFTQVLSGP